MISCLLSRQGLPLLFLLFSVPPVLQAHEQHGYTHFHTVTVDAKLVSDALSPLPDFLDAVAARLCPLLTLRPPEQPIRLAEAVRLALDNADPESEADFVARLKRVPGLVPADYGMTTHDQAWWILFVSLSVEFDGKDDLVLVDFPDLNGEAMHPVRKKWLTLQRQIQGLCN